MKNLKMFEEDKDIIIESLSNTIRFLRCKNKSLESINKELQGNIKQFESYISNQRGFTSYLKFKQYVEDMSKDIDSEDYDDTELSYEFDLALIENDKEKLKDLFNKAMSNKSIELVAMIKMRNEEIEDLEQEIKELKEYI